MQKATQQQTKEHNRNLVLRTIIERDCISRAEIARITGLTRTTVSDLVAELIGAGLVNEAGIGESLGGKSPILLSLSADSRYLIGLDLAHDQFSGAVVNLRGKICHRVQQPIKTYNGDAALQVLYELIDQLVKSSCQPLAGIGVGTPGLVNTSEGMIVTAVNLDWVNLPLAHLLEVRYHLPTFVLNDCQAAAMGEYAFGKGCSADSNLVVVNVGHGVGAGIITHGQLFTGDGGGAGEIGHLDENGTILGATALLQKDYSLLFSHLPEAAISISQGRG
jgi:hypothetical protein